MGPQPLNVSPTLPAILVLCRFAQLFAADTRANESSESEAKQPNCRSLMKIRISHRGQETGFILQSHVIAFVE